jgi:hypothetical protein
MDKNKKFRIKYSVHCQCENFFDKETIVNNVMSEIHAKVELREYCQKNYAEFEFIKITSCEEVDPKYDINKAKIDELLDIIKNL